MSEVGPGDVAAASVPEPWELDRQIAALRAAGAQRLDPLRLHYLEVLSARAQAQSGRVQSLLQDKLAQAVADFQARLKQAHSLENAPLAQAQALGVTQASQALESIQALQPQSLGDLVRSLAQHAPEKTEAGLHGTVAAGPELKSVRLFRNTWSKLSADKQLNKALDQAPKNAGPINSHMLVLRSLALMRDISPDYLNRFMSYVDALQCLDLADQGQVLGAPQVPQDDKGKKPRAPRKTSRAPAKREK